MRCLPTATVSPPPQSEKADVDNGKASKDLKIEETKPRVPNGYGKIANEDQKKQIRATL